MPAFDLSPALASVVLALGAALMWGASDFGGGVLGRRAPILGVLIATQGVGLIVASTGTIALNESAMASGDVWLTVLSAVLAAIGIGCLYRGLAVGRMGIVAPVTGVLVAVTPALIGIALQGLPSAAVIVGLGLAIVAVVVVSVAPGHADGRPSGIGYALLGGASLGLFSAVLSRIDIASLLTPLAMVRALEVLIFVVVVVVGRTAWRVPRAAWPLVLGVGIVDLAGNVAFLTAARIGELSIAAVLSSLYPVVTVLLAATVLRERVTASHAAGVALALVAIALIAGGSQG